MERTNLLARDSHKNQAREFPTVPESGEDHSLAFTERPGEVVPKDVDDATQAGSIQADRPRHTTESSSAAYLEVHVESMRALLGALTEVRSLRDEFFLDDANSRPGLLLAQMTLILERIQHGIPCGKEPFLAVLRAAGLVEEKPAREMVEA